MPLTAELASLPFCCGETEGDKDLEDFFHHNALLYAQERLGKTYCFVNNEGEFSEIVAFFTVSNVIPGSCSWIYCILRYWNILM